MKINDFFVGILGFLIGFVAATVIFYDLDGTPMTFSDDASAREYQRMCLDNGYAVRLIHRDGIYTITCEEVK